MISRRCAYGLQTLLFLSKQDADRYVPVREISEALGISSSFLSKVVGALAEQHVLESYRGPHGGVKLSRDAGMLSVRDVIVALDGTGLFEGCVLGLPGCGQRTPCPMHANWMVARSRIDATFSEATIAELAHQIDETDPCFFLHQNKTK